MIKLSDICIINPKAPILEENLEVSFVPMPKVGEQGEFDPSESKVYQDVKKGFTNFQNGDVLFAKITPCMENGKGAVARSLKNGYGFGSTEFHVLRPDYSKVTSEWLYYLTSWSEFRKDAEINMTGSAGQKRVPKSFLENYEVNLPALQKQTEMAAALDQIGKLIALRKEQLAKLDQLVKSRFIELFGTCDTYELLEDSNIHISDGNYSSKYPTADEFVEEGVPFIRASNMEMNTIVDSNMYFITKEKHAILLKGHVKAGDVLITTRGATIGKIACVPPKHEDSNINAQIVLLRCPNNEYNPLFLSWYLKLDNTQAEIQKLISGSAQPQLPIKRLVQLRILKPNIGLQNQFATFVEQTDKSKLSIQQSLDKLETLKKSLMQEYFG